MGEGAKVSDLEQLKTDAVKCLTDSLFKKLLDVEEVRKQEKFILHLFLFYIISTYPCFCGNR